MKLWPLFSGEILHFPVDIEGRAWLDAEMPLLAARVGTTWPALIETLLGADASAAAGPRVVVETAADLAGAEAVQIVEWVRDRASAVYAKGDLPVLETRPAPGLDRLGDRPMAVVRIDDHRDLILVRKVGAKDFSAEELPMLWAITTLLRHSAAFGRREAAETLHRLTREIVGTLDLDRVLLSIANAAARMISSEIAGVFLVHGQGETRELRMQCSVGHKTPETARLRIPVGRGMAGKVLLTGRPVRVDDYSSTETITKEYLSVAMEEGTHSGLAVPVRDASGEIIGVLAGWRSRSSVFSEEDEQLLEALAGLASIGLVNARVFTEQERLSAEITAAREELAERLAASDEALAIHRRLTAIAAESGDLGGLAQAVHDLLGGAVVIVPAGDRPAVQWPATVRVPREQDSRPLQAAARRTDPGGPFWVHVSIDAAGVRHGTLYAWLTGPPRPREGVILEQSATICAVLLSHEDAMAAASARLRSEFVWDLLEGRRSAEQDDEAVRAANLGLCWGFPARILLLRARGLRALGRTQSWTVEQAERNRMWLAQRITSAAEEITGRMVPIAHRDEHVIAILAAADAARAVAEAVVRRCPFPELSVQVGLSRPVPDVESLPHGLREARVALSAVDDHSSPVMSFEDLGVLQFLIAPAGVEDLHRFADGVLGRLTEYDACHDAQLVVTLDRWFEHGGNTASTARSLRVHSKTLSYRLRRIREIAGLDLEDRQVRLEVELALRVLGRGAQPPEV
jgi:sugar diacid utilization regulator/GAF domain-containing protein